MIFAGLPFLFLFPWESVRPRERMGMLQDTGRITQHARRPFSLQNALYHVFGSRRSLNKIPRSGRNPRCITTCSAKCWWYPSKLQLFRAVQISRRIAFRTAQLAECVEENTGKRNRVGCCRWEPPASAGGSDASASRKKSHFHQSGFSPGFPWPNPRG